jgi:acyl transferase domain-containing protein/acyl carrier protein
MSNTDNFSYDIAVIGMAGRFPKAGDIDRFWRNLCDGVEAISSFTDEELIASGVSRELLNDPNYVKAGVVLDDVEIFDASFFGFNPREAALMDPQHRLFLEQAWSALESAGYNSETCKERIGIYAGSSMSSYLINNLLSNRELLESVGIFQITIGNNLDFLATQVSYKLNLKGPSFTLQTACSTSLVAIHLACQSLLNRECDMALAGGVSIRSPQKMGYLYQNGGILSPDGHCRAFDARAQGTVGGNGLGVVVLKRLADAIADGDHIQAVIKGSAINNDGSSKIGFTAPGVDGQTAVIEEALAMAAVEPETITYIETHGTGTTLGDPIEIAALTQVFRSGAEKRGSCAIGSVKTNIGHLDTAAGVAGFIKTVLALEHKMLPPSLHYQEPNPQIDFASGRFYVNERLREWEAAAGPRRAGVSSFGIGGTNAHLILEEAPAIEPSKRSRPYQLILLSAKTEAALNRAKANLVQHLKEEKEAGLADIAYTLQVGRRAFDHRFVAVCNDIEDAIETLEGKGAEERQVFTGIQERRDRPVLFMFSGQGSQYVNMGLGLYQTESIFRDWIDRCAEILKPRLGLDLRHVIYSDPQQSAGTMEQLRQTFITQPALFAIEYAMAKLLIEWGITPFAMIGHSIGEYVAACISGVFSLEDALSLVAERGRLMQQMPTGSMIAVPLTEKELQPYLEKDEDLSLAAINGPALSVVSGRTVSIIELEERLAQDGITCRRLQTSHAFHSRMMDPILERFTQKVRRVVLNPPLIPFISNVTGTWITAADATDPAYWARHLRQTVRFDDGIVELMKEPDRIMLEVGPGQTLSGPVKQHRTKGVAQAVLSTMRHPNSNQPDIKFLLNTLGQLWLAGATIDWSALHSGYGRRRVPLPTYPFERERYWIEPLKQTGDSGKGQVGSVKKNNIEDWFYAPSWKRSMLPESTIEQNQEDQRSCWLIFSDAAELGMGMEARLSGAGNKVISVTPAEEFAKIGENLFSINPRNREDYSRLIKEISDSGRTPDNILHLWNVRGQDDIAGDELFAQSQYIGFYSLIFLAQALGEEYLTEPIRIGVVTSGLQEVMGDESLRPEIATLLGPCKVIPFEFPNISCRVIDIAVSQKDLETGSRVIKQLMAELMRRASDSVVAYRGAHRWVQIFEPVKLESRNNGGRLREGGVYLMTGGLVEFDLALAEYLIEKVSAKLVLIGPENYPDSEVLKKLESLGGHILVVNADISDRGKMKVAIEQARKMFGTINGVIHSVTATAGGMIQTKRPETAGVILEPRIKGALILDELLKDLPLDFFVLFSSALSMSGAFGQTDYCAANAFLDAFAHDYMAKRGRFAVSIDWNMPQWEDWKASLAISIPEIEAQIEQTREIYGIKLSEGVDAFNRILSGAGPLAQVIVSTQDFQALIDKQKTSIAESLLEQTGRRRQSGTDLNGDYVAPGDEIEELTAGVWQELFGIERIGINENFFDLGGNSLLAIQIVSQLRKIFKVEIPLNRLFEVPTISGVAAVIAESRQNQKELEEMERLLNEIEELSLDDVRAQLEEMQ